MADRLISAFQSIVPGGQRTLPRSSCFQLLQKVCGNVPEARLREILHIAGQPGDGPVDFIALVSWLYQQPSPRPLAVSNSSEKASLRIVHVTDVYTLENFPMLKTLIADKRAEAAARGVKTVSMLTGDFLAPYLLSALDMGRGMMKMIAETPIDILTWGNHDGNDMPHKAVMEREKEFNGVWINTNMTGHKSFAGSKSQTDKYILEVCSPSGTHKRKIGMIGILTAGPGLYKKGAFGGAKIEDPWETIRVYNEKLKTDGVDLVLPLCHLYEFQDERTCKEFDFPLILSGHDHHCVDRMISGTRLLKPGQDARCAIIIDITWQSASDSEPHIVAETIEVNKFAPDQKLAEEVVKAYAVLDNVRQTQLASIPPGLRPLTSFGSRNRHVNMGTFLCSATRDALNVECDPSDLQCDCVLLKGANIRGGKDYDDDEQFTLESLLSETQEQHVIHIFEVPGRCIKVGLRETWKIAGPGWFQYSDDVQIDKDGLVIRIAGAAIQEDRLYRVGSVPDLARASDGPSIGSYLSEDPSRMPDMDAGVPWRSLLMGFFAQIVWQKIWMALDKNKDGKISPQELALVDKDGDGALNERELLQCLHTIAGLDVSRNEMSFVEEVMEQAGNETADKILSLEEMNAAMAKNDV